MATPKEIGNKFFSERNYEAAISEYTRAIMAITNTPAATRNNKELAVLCGNRAECFIRLDLFSDSLKDCIRCIEADPTNVKGYYRKGICLLNLKGYRDAHSCFQQAVKLDPQNTQVIAKLKETTTIVSRADSIKEDVLKRNTESQYSNFPVSLQYDELKGRSVFATRNISEGETLLRVISVAAVLEDSLMASHCSGCFVDIKELKENPKDNLCKKCNRATFCSKCAQIPAHKLIHEEECPIIVQIFTTDSKYVIENSRDQRLLFRLLLLHVREKKEKQDLRKGHDDVLSLAYNKSQLHPMQLDAFKECATVAINIASRHITTKIDLTIDDVVAMQCSILQNAHELTDPLQTSTSGIGVFPTASYLNHSCRPNCAFYIDNEGFLSFKCVRSIREGEEICTSYIDILRPTRERQKILDSQYCFSCTCERCIQNEEDVFLEGCVCEKEGCGGLLQEFEQSNEDIQNQTYECPECKTRAKLLPYICVEDEVVSMYEKSQESNPPEETLIRRALSLAETKLHRFHFMKCIMRRTLIDTEFGKGQWTNVVADLTELLAGYSFIFPDDPFIMGQELGRRYYQLAKGMKEIGHPKAIQTAYLVITIFGVTIGSDHRTLQLIKSELLPP